MTCAAWRPQLVLAAEDRLDELKETERDLLSDHLLECDRCREALDVQRDVRRVLRSRVDAEVPAGFIIRVVSSLDRGVSWIDMLRWRTWTFRLIPVAMGLLLVSLVTARPMTEAGVDGDVGLPALAEAWAFGASDVRAAPAFTVWGRDDVDGELLLDAVLVVDPDEPLVTGDPDE